MAIKRHGLTYSTDYRRRDTDALWFRARVNVAFLTLYGNNQRRPQQLIFSVESRGVGTARWSQSTVIPPNVT